MKTKTETLIKALRILERAIPSEDGIANTTIGEAANRLEELQAELDRTRMRDCERDAAVIERFVDKVMPRIDTINPIPLDINKHCCEWSLYRERERAHKAAKQLRKQLRRQAKEANQ